MATPLSIGHWEFTILDADPGIKYMASCAVGDIDGDGNLEMIIGGLSWEPRPSGLLWYRPVTRQKGRIDTGSFPVGLALEDIDGDGRPEVVTGIERPQTGIAAYKPGDPSDLSQPWIRTMLHAAHLPERSAHDILFVDIDDDGRREMIANQISADRPTLSIFRPTDDPWRPWLRTVVQSGTFEEGLAAADLDGDGRIEIISGTNWYRHGPGGPFAGRWQQMPLAGTFRDMVRVALVDITGTGRPDVIVSESEYADGRLSWFENRTVEDPSHPWIEHPIEPDRNIYFGHTLHAWRDPGGTVRFFLAEMAMGGYGAKRNPYSTLTEHLSRDNGRSWQRHVLHRGMGTHEARVCDIDNDGQDEIVGKEWIEPRVHIFKRRPEPSPLSQWTHRFIDRDRPGQCTDLLAVDIDGDGVEEVVCGRWWYHQSDWRRHEIPGIAQVIASYDLDGDGREELIATLGQTFSNELCWIKPVDPARSLWQRRPVGWGMGDWPHGAIVVPVGAGRRPALVVAWHGACREPQYPQVFTIPGDPQAAGPWPVQTLATLRHSEQLAAADVAGNGLVDIIAGNHWIENLGDGRYLPHTILQDFDAAQTAVGDLNGDGRPDVVLGQQVLTPNTEENPTARLVWCEHPGGGSRDPWCVRTIDWLRCPHSVSLADLDGDGQLEIICGEHETYQPYRTGARLLIYKKADPAAVSWTRHVLDDRFEHHCGAKTLRLIDGRTGIISHGWTDRKYIHLWQPR